MELLSQVFDWFLAPENLNGPSGVVARLVEHMQISALAVCLGALVGLPLGLVIGHTRKGEFVVASVANLGRAIPSFAILAIALPFTIRAGLGLGFWPTVLALWLLAIPPILTNTYVGVQVIDPDTIEAAKGMGMSEGQILRKIEVPLAAPLIVVGFRTAAVQVVATATLAALVAWGGLGRFIIDGFAIRDSVQITAGALLVAALAVSTELLFGSIQKIVTPKMLSAPVQPGQGAAT